MAQTLFDKIWDRHLVSSSSSFPDILYIDTHYINETSSRQAFEDLRTRNLPVFRPKQTIALAGLNERTIFLPGQTVGCGIRESGIPGAFGALAIGIRSAQVKQILATQCLLQRKPKKMKIELHGRLKRGVDVKDVIHFLIDQVSADGASGYFIEFAGEVILNLNMEERIALCGMSREIGAAGSLIAPDRTTAEHLANFGFGGMEKSGRLVHMWDGLYSDEASVFDEVLEFDAEDIKSRNYRTGISRPVGHEERTETCELTEEYNDTDYLLTYADEITEFERSAALKIFDGVEAVINERYRDLNPVN